MGFSKIKSYAKINLSLNITGKFNNQNHKVESLVTFIDYHDLIYIKEIKSKTNKIYFKGKFSKKIKSDNTISKLLKILDKKKLIKGKKFEIKVIKNIPQESGMGGGSMNAASIINFLLKKKFLKIDNKGLLNLSKLIGHDVALGLNYSNLILLSNGSIKKVKKKLNLYSLVIKPDFGCSTRFIYSKVNCFSKSKYKKSKSNLFSLQNLTDSSNDLEKIAFKYYPKLNNLKLFLIKLQNVIFVRMTGSGSSVIAYFKSKKNCTTAAIQFKRKFKNYWCISSKTI